MSVTRLGSMKNAIVKINAEEDILSMLNGRKDSVTQHESHSIWVKLYKKPLT